MIVFRFVFRMKRDWMYIGRRSFGFCGVGGLNVILLF